MYVKTKDGGEAIDGQMNTLLGLWPGVPDLSPSSGKNSTYTKGGPPIENFTFSMGGPPIENFTLYEVKDSSGLFTWFRSVAIKGFQSQSREQSENLRKFQSHQGCPLPTLTLS